MTDWDERFTAACKNEGIVLRRYSHDKTFVAEYNIGKNKSIYRAPVIKTVGRPEPGLPMKSFEQNHEDMLCMFSALVEAIEEQTTVSFDGRISGSYKWVETDKESIFVTEMISSGNEMSISTIQLSKLDYALVKFNIAKFEE